MQPTLWDAIDADRRRWIRAGALLGLLVALLVLAVWIVVISRSLLGFRLVACLIAPITAVLMFPLIRASRELRTREAIGAIPVATGMASDTKRALHDVGLAAGIEREPALLMYVSDSPNAFVTSAGGKLSISVSSAFAALPKVEQRAGMAMLVGRSLINTASFAAEHQVSETMREDPLPPDRDPILFAAWLDAAVAGDREGLRILKEPAPMIELLERLSVENTLVPEFASGEAHDAVFGFLAWPYLDTAKVLAETASVREGTLPPRAAATVAALIAEERVMNNPVLGHRPRSSAFNSGAEALRALRLREVSGAEGVVAGWSSSVASRRSEGERHEGEQGDGGRDEGARSAASAVPAVVPEVPPATPSDMPASRSNGPRIAVVCPSCRAQNAPGNRVCVACGAKLSAGD